MAENDCDKKGLTSYHGFFYFNGLNFGCWNARETFQPQIGVLPTNVKWHFSLIFAEDIVIFLRTPAKHFKNVLQVLELLNEAVMTLNRKTCKDFTKHICPSQTTRPGPLIVSTRKDDTPGGPWPQLWQKYGFLVLLPWLPPFWADPQCITVPLNKKRR